MTLVPLQLDRERLAGPVAVLVADDAEVDRDVILVRVEDVPRRDADRRERDHVVEARVPGLARLTRAHLGTEHLPGRVEMLPRDGRLDEVRRGVEELLAVGGGQLHPRRLAVHPRRPVVQRRLVRLPGVPDGDRTRSGCTDDRQRSDAPDQPAAEPGRREPAAHREGASLRRRCSPSRSAPAASNAGPTSSRATSRCA